MNYTYPTCINCFVLLFISVFSHSDLINAQVNWNGGGDGISWDDKLNWDTGKVPTISDDVTIDFFADVRIALPANARSIYIGPGNSLVVENTLTLTDFLEIDQSATCSFKSCACDWIFIDNSGTLVFTNGLQKELSNGIQLINNATGLIRLTNQQDLRVDNGVINNAGKIELEGGADLLVVGDSISHLTNQPTGIIENIGGQSEIRVEMTNYGTIRSSAGILELIGNKTFMDGGDLDADSLASLLIQGDTATFIGTTYGNPGGNVQLQSIFKALPGGSVNFAGQGIQWFAGPLVGGQTLTNQGYFRLVQGANKAVVDNSSILNAGFMELEPGQNLLLNQGTLINSDTIALHASSSIAFTDGTLHQSINQVTGLIEKRGGLSSARIAGDLTNFGLLRSTEGTFRIEAETDLMDGCMLDATAGASLDLVVENKTIRGLVAGNPEGDVNLFSNLESKAHGRIHFDGSGLQWRDGALVNGDTLINSRLLRTESGTPQILDSSVLCNQGLFVLSVDIFIEEGTLINEDTIYLGSAADLGRDQDTALFQKTINTQTGLIEKISGVFSPSRIYTEFENHGIIKSSVGLFEIPGEAEFNNGSVIHADSAAVLNLSGEKKTFKGLVTGNPEGAVVLLANIVHSENGHLHFTGKGFQWGVGALMGGDTLSNSGILKLESGIAISLEDTSVLINQGLLEFGGGDLQLNDGILLNEDSIFLDSGSDISFTSGALHKVINTSAGTLIKIGATSSNIFADTYNAGEIIATYGPLDFKNTLENQNSGVLRGTSTILINGNAFSNDGTTSPGLSTGILTIQGNYSQSSEGFLEIEISGPVVGTEYDRIAVTGDAEMEGNIRITLDYHPTIGETFDVLTAANLDTCVLGHDTLVGCFNNERQAFVVNCLSNAIRLEYIGPTNVPANCRNAVVFLDTAGMASISPDSIFVSDVLGECDLDSIALDKSTFTCSDTGVQQVVLTVTSLGGNQSSCLAQVSVLDTLKPIAICQSATVQLDTAGIGMLDAITVDGGSTDICGIDQRVVTPSIFSCSDIGEIQAVLTISDPSGNVSTCTTTVTVADEVNPKIQNCPSNIVANPDSGICGAIVNWTAPGVSDNCSGATIQQTGGAVPGSEFPIGISNINYEATDAQNNTANCAFTVTVLQPAQKTAFVDANAGGTNSGLSWANAFTSLEMALSNAGCFQDIDTILLAEGTYLPDNAGPANRASTFEIHDSVLVLGGYPTGGGPRNPVLNKTRLSGNIGNASSDADNVYHVVTVPPAATVTLDGVVIEDGHANAAGNENGGGILNAGSVVLKNVSIENCKASGEGSAIYNHSGTAEVRMAGNVTIEE